MVSALLVGYILFEWIYVSITHAITKRINFELELIAFFLSGIGLTVCASFNDEFAYKQLFALILGIVVYLTVILLTKDVNVASKLRTPAAICSILILGANLVLAENINGTLNWIDLGFFSIQPSELVKIAFILVGAASLEKLLSNMSLTKYVVFSLGCIGFLFLMKDFGTALIFFFTFILIAFMRSGNIRTIVLICTVALMGAALVIYFKPYVANRFAAYRHVWDFIDTTGYQQTRVLIYSASGGLFGLGIGEGYLRDIYAASTDLVFGLICEEMGLLLGIIGTVISVRVYRERQTWRSMIEADRSRIEAKAKAEAEFKQWEQQVQADAGNSGSTGDGYELAKQAGHTITPLKPSLVPLNCHEGFCMDLQGLSLRNVEITVMDMDNYKEVYKDFGEMLFTHFGVSGPLVLSASAHMRGDIRQYRMFIDLKPALDDATLDARLIADLTKYSQRDFVNSLSDLLPQKLIDPVIRQSRIDPRKKSNAVTREERAALRDALKKFPLTPVSFRPIDEAIITSGGVKVSEIDPKTMESKIVPGLYFAGEILDIQGPCGGYNLQWAWSSGYLAGISAGKG